MRSIPHLSDKLSSKQSFVCTICPMARQQRLSFPDSSIHSSKPFQLVHVDTWGPYNTPTYNGYRYFITFVDDYTRATWTHLLSLKDNAFSILKSFTFMVKTHFHSHIQIFRYDNAFEFGGSHEASKFFLLKMVSYIKLPFLTLPNKMVCWKGKINTSLIHQKHYFFSPNYPWNIGETVS